MFTVDMYVRRLIAKKVNLGMVIDCTALDLHSFDSTNNGSTNGSTDGSTTTSTTDNRWYFHNMDEWEEFGIDYHRLTPSTSTSTLTSKSNSTRIGQSTIDEFLNVCKTFWKENPTLSIALYDSLGSHSTASFLIAYYLCHVKKAPVHSALASVEQPWAHILPNSSNTTTYSTTATTNTTTNTTTTSTMLTGLYSVPLIQQLQHTFKGQRQITIDLNLIPQWWFQNDKEVDNKDNNNNANDNNNDDSNEKSKREIITIPPYRNNINNHEKEQNGPLTKKPKLDHLSTSTSTSSTSTTNNNNNHTILLLIDQQAQKILEPLSSTSQRYNRAMNVLQQLTSSSSSSSWFRKHNVLTSNNISTKLVIQSTDTDTDTSASANKNDSNNKRGYERKRERGRRYNITWKSIGRDGLLLVLSDGTFFIESQQQHQKDQHQKDQQNQYQHQKDQHRNPSFCISVLKHPLYFPNPQKPSTLQHRTLLDVTLVLDQESKQPQNHKEQQQQQQKQQQPLSKYTPRFLINDILAHMGGITIHKPFTTRLKYIIDGIISIRKQQQQRQQQQQKSQSQYQYQYEKEIIKIRAREYFELQKFEFVLQKVSKGQLHDTNGIMMVSLEQGYYDIDAFLIWNEQRHRVRDRDSRKNDDDDDGNDDTYISKKEILDFIMSLGKKHTHTNTHTHV